MKHLEHVGIMVTDMDRSLAFYESVLGLRLRRREWVNDNIELAFLAYPGYESTEVELIAGSGMEQREGLVNHLAFRVEDIESELARLKENGVELVDEAPRRVLGNVKIAFFKGPDGERLELVER